MKDLNKHLLAESIKEASSVKFLSNEWEFMLYMSALYHAKIWGENHK